MFAPRASNPEPPLPAAAPLARSAAPSVPLPSGAPTPSFTHLAYGARAPPRAVARRHEPRQPVVSVEHEFNEQGFYGELRQTMAANDAALQKCATRCVERGGAGGEQTLRKEAMARVNRSLGAQIAFVQSGLADSLALFAAEGAVPLIVELEPAPAAAAPARR